MNKETLAISYDELKDAVTIAGKQFSGDFFRYFGVTREEGRVILALFCDDQNIVRIERLYSKSLSDLIDFVNG